MSRCRRRRSWPRCPPVTETRATRGGRQEVARPVVHTCGVGSSITGGRHTAGGPLRTLVPCSTACARDRCADGRWPLHAGARRASGAFGYLRVGISPPQFGRADRHRAAPTDAFGVNLFVPGIRSTMDLSVRRADGARGTAVRDRGGEPRWTTTLTGEARPAGRGAVPVVSFTFGLPAGSTSNGCTRAPPWSSR